MNADNDFYRLTDTVYDESDPDIIDGTLPQIYEHMRTVLGPITADGEAGKEATEVLNKIRKGDVEEVSDYLKKMCITIEPIASPNANYR